MKLKGIPLIVGLALPSVFGFVHWGIPITGILIVCILMLTKQVKPF